jgi:hypothetical protein
LGKVAQGFRRRSVTKNSEDDNPPALNTFVPSQPPPVPSSSSRRPPQMEVSIPHHPRGLRSLPPASLTPASPPPPSVLSYSPIITNQSTSSLGTFSTEAFAPLAPGTTDYQFEFQRLQHHFRISQEDLHLEQERVRVAKKQAEDTRAFYEGHIATREVEFQQVKQELDDLRQRLPQDPKGKRRQ